MNEQTQDAQPTKRRSRLLNLVLCAVFVATLNIADALLFGSRYLTSLEWMLIAFIGAWCADGRKG